MADSNSRDARIDAAIDEYLRAADAGTPPDRDAFLAKYPDLAASLAEFLDDHLRMRDAVRPAAESATITAKPDLDPHATVGLDGAQPVLLGTVRYFGDYELLTEIARGGMGVVYKARQVSLNRVVALKMILAGQLASPTDIERFRLEAKAAGGLDHPNILPIYEVGEHDGHQYFSMKLVEGGSLTDLLKQSPPPNVGMLVGLLEQVARGVHYAHQRGVLHRDLKPSNVLLDGRETPVITDFGLAKRTEGDSSLTLSGAIVGTPSYMAPEQARGEKGITTAADIYSLGAVLYELLTGQPPFRSESIAQTLRMVEEREPTPPTRINPAADRDLEAVALKCLEKEPARRYETAGALADDLTRWLRGEPVTARRAGAARRAWKWVKRNPAVAGLSAAMILALVAGSITSVAYATRAGRRAKEAAENEQTARQQEQIVRNREEALKDVVCASNYQQARAVRLAARPGWRTSALDLLKKSADLRTRPRDATGPSDKTADLPDVADLRGEAIMALIAHDIRPVRELPFGVTSLVEFSPDGRFLLRTGVVTGRPRDVEVRVIDLATGVDVHRMEITTGNAKRTELERIVFLSSLMNGGAALSPDGSRIACRSSIADGAVSIHALPSGRMALQLRDPTKAKPLETVARTRFSADGKKVAAIRHNDNEAEAVVWDIARPNAPRSLGRESIKNAGWADWHSYLDDGGLFTGLRFSPDETQISFATADRKTVRVVDLTADPGAKPVEVPVGGELHTLEWHPREPILAMAATKTDKTLTVVLWDLTQGKALATCDPLPAGTEARLVSLAFSPDGRWLAVAGTDSTVRVYGARDGAERFRLTNTVSLAVHRMRWTPAGDLAVVGMMESLRIWKPDPIPLADTVHRLRGAGRPAFSPDGRRLAVFAPTAAPQLNPARPRGADPNWDRVAMIDRPSGRIERSLPGLTTNRGRLYFAPDGKRLVLEQSAEVAVRDADTGTEVYRRSPPKAVRTARWAVTAYLPDGRLVGLASTSDGTGAARLIGRDLGADRELYIIPRVASGFDGSEMEASPDGSEVYVDPPRPLLLFPVDPPEALAPGHLYELASGRLIAEVPPLGGAAGLLTQTGRISPGGNRALTINVMAAAGADILWTNALWAVRALPSGEELLRVPNRSMADHANDFSPDGRLVALGSERGQVEVWQVDAKALLFRYQPHGGKTVNGLAFSPEGDIATVSDEDDRVVVLRMKEIRERLTQMGLGW